MLTSVRTFRFDMMTSHRVQQAVANQTKLLSEVTGTPVDQLDFKFNLWVEALGMYQKGLLKLPPQTSLVMYEEHYPTGIYVTRGPWLACHSAVLPATGVHGTTTSEWSSRFGSKCC